MDSKADNISKLIFPNPGMVNNTIKELFKFMFMSQCSGIVSVNYHPYTMLRVVEHMDCLAPPESDRYHELDILIFPVLCCVSGAIPVF